MRLNIKAKFMMINIILIVPMLVLIIYFSVVFVDQYNLFNAQNTLLNSSYILQAYLYRYFSENPVQELSDKDLYFLNYEISKMVNLRTQAFYLKSNSYFDSQEEEKDVFSDFANDPELESALENEKNYILKRIGSKRYMLFSFPFYSSGLKMEGVVRLIYPLTEIDQQKNKLIKILSILGLIVLAIINVLYLYFTKQIVTPLYRLKAVVQRFSSGKLNDELIINSGDEIEELANSFNKMARDISGLIENLKIEKDKQKNFYNNMTHEIRTPLTIILGYTDLIRRVDSVEVRDECLNYIESEAKRLLRLINELLKSSKLEHYNFKIKKEACNLSKLLDETIGIIRYKANKYSIEIKQEIEEEIYLLLDKDKIKEAVLNLIDNAINYSGSEQIDISLTRAKGQVELKIKDYGQGIPKAQLKKINDINIDNISNYAGHGFGLSISRKIIELHGGEFNIQSKQGDGTLIIIKLEQCRGLK